MFFITKDESEIYYEISYSNDHCLLLSGDGLNYLFTDGRYFEEAKAAASNCEVLLASSSLFKSLASKIRTLGIKKISFDPDKLSFFEHSELQKLSNVTLTPRKNALSAKRAIKSAIELYKIKQAVKIGKAGFKEFAKKVNSLKSADELTLNYLAKQSLAQSGKYALSFEPIVALDENAANPHARPTDKKLKKDGLVLFDGGIKFERYCSDRTRTAFFEDGFRFKKEQNFKDKKLQHIYDTVLKAQESAIKSAKVGMKAKELDKIARDIIEKAGYGEYFVHSLGHGVGLDIHEHPYINKRSEEILQENMVFTVEPGIYIPNHYGVRIEDMVVMTPHGAEVL
ncbi:MAG: aminopeptidase P family protein [Campylobacterales bacterium]|nr:aminopeptidase P family protein [Campylobacterales bacterium]